jgi:hypothetical protein
MRLWTAVGAWARAWEFFLQVEDFRGLLFWMLAPAGDLTDRYILTTTIPVPRGRAHTVPGCRSLAFAAGVPVLAGGSSRRRQICRLSAAILSLARRGPDARELLLQPLVVTRRWPRAVQSSGRPVVVSCSLSPRVGGLWPATFRTRADACAPGVVACGWPTSITVTSARWTLANALDSPTHRVMTFVLGSEGLSSSVAATSRGVGRRQAVLSDSVPCRSGATFGAGRGYARGCCGPRAAAVSGAIALT